MRTWIRCYKKYTLLPELLEFLGATQFERFINIFGGIHFKIPTRKQLDQWKRNQYIYKRMSVDSSIRTMKSLSQHYSLSVERVRHVYLEMRDLLKEP